MTSFEIHASTSRIFSVTWIIFGLLSFGNAQSPLHRLELTRGDEFRICAAGVLGKPILTDMVLRSTTLLCPVSKEKMLQGLEQHGIYNFELDDLYYWAPAGKFTPHSRFGPQAQWEYLSVDVRFETVADSRLLSDAERQIIGRAILGVTRLSPVPTPYLPGKDGETAELQYKIFLSGHHLGKKGPESIIAISGLEDGWARIVYGEIEAGKYHPLWESPLFESVRLKIGYSDVDGDGTEEILISSRSGSRLETMLLTVFDKNGHELTRQADDCEMFYLLQPDEATCPIGGLGVELIDAGNGRKNILARGSAASGTVDVVYELKNGVYRLGAPAMKNKPMTPQVK